MGGKSNIEWTDASWTPIRARNRVTGKIGWHCEHATTGCEFCYAEGMNKRLGTGLPFKPGHRRDIDIFLDDEMLLAPLRWKRARMIFVCSMTDIFAEFVTNDMLDKIFAVMALAPQHTFQVLTKRAERMRKYLTSRDGIGNGALCDAINKIPAGLGNRRGALSMPLSNVWLGVSTERQQEADERIHHLQMTPATVRFLSVEPLVRSLDLGWVKNEYGTGSVLEPGEINGGTGQCVAIRPAIDWVIVGGESGPGARPMSPIWVRALRNQCWFADVPFFFKQWGEWQPLAAADLDTTRAGDMWLGRDGYFEAKPPRIWAPADFAVLRRVGKAKSGRLLDGVEHNGFPETREFALT